MDEKKYEVQPQDLTDYKNYTHLRGRIYFLEKKLKNYMKDLEKPDDEVEYQLEQIKSLKTMRKKYAKGYWRVARERWQKKAESVQK